jgi:DNA-binding CsgD family transcriptional regulator
MPQKDVDMFAVQIALGIGARQGIAPQSLLEGLPLTAAQVDSRQVAVTWDQYIEVCDRLRDRLGGNQAMADAAAAHFPAITSHISDFAALFVSPVRFTRFLVHVIDPRIWPCLRIEMFELPDDQVRVVHRLPEHYRGGESFFWAGVGAWRTVPCRLGLPETHFSQLHIEPCLADFVMKLPRAQTVSARALRAAERAFARYAAFELETEGAYIIDNFKPTGADALASRLAQARAAWRLSDRQAMVLRAVAEGKGNKAIAEGLGCSIRTVEQHLTDLLNRAGAQTRTELTARVWKFEG